MSGQRVDLVDVAGGLTIKRKPAKGHADVESEIYVVSVAGHRGHVRIELSDANRVSEHWAKLTTSAPQKIYAIFAGETLQELVGRAEVDSMRAGNLMGEQAYQRVLTYHRDMRARRERR